MVGGKAPELLGDERVYRGEFPERPGALSKFLSGLGQRWNISLFHYRNHGAAFGRILVGLQDTGQQKAAVEAKLNAIGYRFWDESANLAYRRYLGKDEG